MKQEAFDKKCYKMITEGFTKKEIADEMKCDPKTVHNALTREFARRQQMLAYKRRRGSRNGEQVKLDDVKGVYLGAPGREFEDEIEYSQVYIPTSYGRLSPQERLIFHARKK